MKLLLSLCITGFMFLGMKSQNNYIVKTDDGRRVLLKDDFTWEYIDLKTPESNTNTPIKEDGVISPTEPSSKPTITNNCDLGLGFKEPKLDTKTQALLKRSRSSIGQLKKKVAKKEKCGLSNIILLSARETKAKGTYTFCTCNGKVAYKRNGSSFFRKGKLF